MQFNHKDTEDTNRCPMLAPLECPRRYLVGFNPLDLPHHFTDVLVIGGGLAGLRTALGIDPHYRVLVVTKEEIREVLIQVAVYAGVPAAVAAFRYAREVFAEHKA